MFHEILARDLDLALGSYIHQPGSLHVYSRHYRMVEKFADYIGTSERHHYLTDGTMPALKRNGETSTVYQQWRKFAIVDEPRIRARLPLAPTYDSTIQYARDILTRFVAVRRAGAC